MQKARGDLEGQKAALLTKAALEAARRLGLSPGDTANIIGVPQGALAAMKAGTRVVDGVNGEAECADALVRITRRLGALLGDADTNWRAWIRRENDALDDKPLTVMSQRRGAMKVASFLEAASNI